MKNKTIAFAGTLITFLFLVTMATLAASEAPKAATLTNADCVKCHPKEVATIERNGGLHKTAVGCMDCHVEHPPEGENAIPKCSMCHSGKPHYELEGCLSCHSDPHEPLALKLKDDLTKPCLTCHPQQGKELQSHPSKHTTLYCTFCHATHKEIPDCSQCHEPHAKGQTMKECLVCHPVHMPLVIHYPNETPRSFCTPCHEKEGQLLAMTKTKHQTFTCAFCHRGEHKAMPTCETCHGQPHSAATHKKTPNCLDCHLDAHNLAK